MAPAASRVVRVRFSASGVTADDDIAALLTTVPADQPVLVVSTDREVADNARAQGAMVLSQRRVPRRHRPLTPPSAAEPTVGRV